MLWKRISKVVTDKSFQRIGSVSNAHVGSDFESAIAALFARDGLHLRRNFPVSVGAGRTTKKRKFDLGLEDPAILVECKSHTWTTGGNIPSAKITVWNESMYYFYISPSGFRKIMVVRRSFSERRGVTLAGYYLRNYDHMIPPNVELWEYDEDRQTAERLG